MANKKQEYTRRRKSNPARRKKKKRSNSWLLTLALFILVGLVSLYAKTDMEVAAQKPANTVGGNMELVVIPDDMPEITKQYCGFFVSFNPAHHLPNYVSWTLTPAEAAGTGKRVSKFRTDNDVYGSATPADYKGSGFDRGHMAPAADMKWSEEAMSDCHYMTNMCPQDHSLNGGVWNTLENNCRVWTRRDSDLVIICGPVLSDELPRAIGAQSVSVPERFFKVVYAPYANPPRAIGFVMPNSAVNERLEDMAVTVDRVEEITGYDFFSELPDEIESEIESKFDYRQWTKRKR